MKNVDLTRVHYLTGPFEIEGAEPGDVLVVEIQDVQPFQEQPWGSRACLTRQMEVDFWMNYIRGRKSTSFLLSFFHFSGRMASDSCIVKE